MHNFSPIELNCLPIDGCRKKKRQAFGLAIFAGMPNAPGGT